jgi:hypothetical protein
MSVFFDDDDFVVFKAMKINKEKLFSYFWAVILTIIGLLRPGYLQVVPHHLCIT